MPAKARTLRERLAASEAKYHAVFDYSPLPVCIYAVETFRILDVNHAAVRQYGYEKSELVGSDVRQLLHPEDVARFERAPCRAKDGPQQGPVWRHRTRDGRDILVSVETHVIDFENQVAQMALAHDVTAHRTTTLRARQAEKKLRTAFTQTIQVLLSASEQRDAYTAEHQHRVGELTVAIASEMQLPAPQIEGLRFGAMVHDIGKLGIPSELLSLPRKLKVEEFALVKMHSQIGYEIVKDVDYPWPIGKVVLQHHERLDGSGYPNQLRGNDICLEARVLAVADAIEAMASHRPYRPAIGVESAVAEVREERGTKYDADVVDACLAVHARGELRTMLAEVR
ncbi:MAG: HD-GYP domain-containing protein [Burkholderiales bacterium]